MRNLYAAPEPGGSNSKWLLLVVVALVMVVLVLRWVRNTAVRTWPLMLSIAGLRTPRGHSNEKPRPGPTTGSRLYPDHPRLPLLSTPGQHLGHR